MPVEPVAPHVEHVEGRPTPALRPYVEGYTGYAFAGLAPGFHTGLPSRHLTFIVALDEPVDLVALPDPSRPAEAFDALVGGLHTRPARIRHGGRQSGVQLRLTPRGARALLGCPAASLASEVVHLDAVIGRRAGELRERLGEAGSWPERFAVLDDVLADLERDHPEPPAELVGAWSLLDDSGGTVTIDEMARELGWSRRHLAGRFQHELGVSPKELARVMRFERARALLQLPTAPSVATVAAHCGYADQAHLTREWKRLTGAPPTEWRRQEDPTLLTTPS